MPLPLIAALAASFVDVRIRRIPFILSFILAVLGLRRPWVPGGPGPFGGLASASGT